MLIRITAPHFVAGLVVKGPCAPILARHLQGRTLPEIRRYCQRRGWELEELPDDVPGAAIEKGAGVKSRPPY